jgi:CubicO group peptidase (beta-lactamase class C family)
MSDDLLRGLGEVVEQERERWGVPGITVGILRDGEVTKAGYGVTSIETEQPVTADTLFQIGSNSKVYTTTLLMTLVDDGLVDLDAPVTTYLPDLRLKDEQALPKITPRHLVTHQSGVYGDYFDDFGWGDDALERSVANMVTLDQVYPPGDLWSYTNSGFNIAGLIVEKVLGQPFEVAMRERVLDPLDLGHTFYFPHEVYAYPHAVGHNPEGPGSDVMVVARQFWLNRALGPAGGLHSNVEDILRFDSFHMGNVDAKRGDKPILTEQSRLAMQQEQLKAAGSADAWGLGWALRVIDGVKMIGHNGGTNGFITRNAAIPDKQVAFAIFTNSLYGGTAIRTIERWILEHVAGLHDRDPEVTTLPNEQLERLIGTYRTPESPITFIRQGNGLRMQMMREEDETGEKKPEPPVDLLPIGDHEFMATSGREEGMRVQFIDNPDGSVRFARVGSRVYAPVQ